MIDYLSILSRWMDEPSYMLIVLIGLYFVLSVIDFLMGIVNAVYTQKVKFSSRTAQFGIIRKIGTLAVMILVVPLALLFPLDIAVYSLMVLYIGIVVTELYSILGHLGIVTDNQKHKYIVGTLFTAFIEKLILIGNDNKQNNDDKNKNNKENNN